MLNIPDSERQRFEALLLGEANRYGVGVDDYLRKVWYHQEAARLGEFVAMSLVQELLEIAPKGTPLPKWLEK